MDVDEIRRSLNYYGTWMQIIADVQSDLDDALILRGNANCCDKTDKTYMRAKLWQIQL